MTDTDNTGESAIAWYGPIRIKGSLDGHDLDHCAVQKPQGHMSFPHIH
jgi:hypothetical protein